MLPFLIWATLLAILPYILETFSFTPAYNDALVLEKIVDKETRLVEKAPSIQNIGVECVNPPSVILLNV